MGGRLHFFLSEKKHEAVRKTMWLADAGCDLFAGRIFEPRNRFPLSLKMQIPWRPHFRTAKPVPTFAENADSLAAAFSNRETGSHFR